MPSLLSAVSPGFRLESLVLPVTILAALALVLAIVRAWTSRGATRVTRAGYAVVDRIKDIGDMVALSVFYKEISTAESGSVPILLTSKRMALISEFDIEWRYDLRQVVVADDGGRLSVTLPPPRPKVNTGEVTIHSTESGKLLGLIPMNTFGKDDWNRLVKEAREHAVASAREQVRTGLLARIQASAEQSLKFLFASAGLPEVAIAFAPAMELENEVGTSVEQAIRKRQAA